MRVYLAICIIKKQKALHKTFIAMENKMNLQFNKIIHLEDSVVMYGIYNSETLEKVIDHLYIKNIILQLQMKNSLSVHLVLGILGLQLKMELTIIPINSLLYLRVHKQKNMLKCMEEFINQLHMYVKAIRILSKGYLSHFPFTTFKITRKF